MPVRFSFLLFIALGLEINALSAQSLFSVRNNITYITMDNGLLHNYIDDIYKDKQGFLWISTEGGGLSRYDGYEFTHYNTNTERIKLKSNFIRNVCEDDFGRLWIASESGMDILDMASVQKVIPADPKGKFSGLLDLPVISVLKDAKGNIWMYCGDFLYKILFDSKGEVAEIWTLPYVLSGVQAIALQDVDEDGNIWAGLGNTVYKLYQGENGKLKPVLVAPGLILEEGIFISAFKAKEEDVWIGADRGLIRYNRSREIIKSYHYDKENEHSLSQNHVTFLEVTNDKQLIVCTLKGINIYNPVTDDFERITQESVSNNSSLNSNFINCLLIDGDIVWIGTETGGVNKMTPRKLSVYNFTYNKNDPHSLSKNPVNAIYEDYKGDLWVGTVEGGLNRKSFGSNQFSHYTAESTSRLSHNSVSAITADRNDRLWVGTWGNGISIFDINHPELPAEKYISAQTFPGFSVDFIGALCYDSINRGMWIGCNPGIFFYEFETGNLTVPFPRNETGNIHGAIGSLIDQQGRLWMGCMEGVYVVDLHSRSADRLFSYRYLKYKLDDPDSHLIEKITCFYQSDNGALWLGSNGYGIYRFISDPEGFGSFVSYTTKQGLINNDVKGILEDEQGNLWISTNNGLSCFDPTTNRFANYAKEDGLASNQFYWNAYCRSRNGILYFGGLNGLTAIDSNRRVTGNRTGKVVLTRLRVSNEEILPGNKYIDSDISMTESLRLHESNKSFSLEFSALNVEPQASAVYSYRLEGFDEHWINVPATRRFAGYTNLPPGNYTFQVKYLPEGITDNDLPVTEIRVIVSPFFYKTTWFVFLMILTIGCSVIYLYRLRIRTLKNQQEEKIARQKTELIEMSKKVEELTFDKLAFFTNITHEFRTPITLIIGPIERALKLSRNPQVVEQLNFVERNSKYLLSLVNQLMDFRKVESGKLEILRIKDDILSFIDSLLVPFEVFAGNRNIVIRKFYRLHSPEILFDQDAMQKVITNLLSNAVKFTPDGGVISLYITSFIDKETQKEKLFLAIKDTGTGIVEDDIAKIFDRFYQSGNHVKFPVYGQSGTGIGLYLCKRIVELQEGNIEVRNNRKNGCTFHITLPLLREERMNPSDTGEKIPVAPDEKPVSVPAHFLPGKRTVLVTEDNRDMRCYLHSILSEQYNVLEAENGAEALSLLSVHNVDFIICDWMMPVMDGLELSRRVKDNFAISHIPFLMLTAKTAQESRIESYRAGVDEYLLKPFNDELLLARISNILENRKRYQQQFASNMQIEALQMQEESSDKKFINKLLEVIKENYKNPYYESSDFTEAMGVSKSLLNKKMQSIIGQSVGQFIRNYRLNIARELIDKNRITKNMNVSEIAYEVGFNDPKYFTRCFTRRFNIPPSSLLADATEL